DEEVRETEDENINGKDEEMKSLRGHDSIAKCCIIYMNSDVKSSEILFMHDGHTLRLITAIHVSMK
ncbi:hypothetical protein L9F63_027925, partial [Diploptera punctata]